MDEARKKVLVISTVSMNRNGITNVIYQYYQKLRSSVQFDFVATGFIDDDLKAELESNGSKVFLLPNRSHDTIKYLMQLLKLCRGEKFDVVHVHGNSATMTMELFCAYLGGIKSRIAHGHAASAVYERIARFFRPFFDGLYTAGLACSKEAGKFLFGKNKFIVLPNAFDINQCKYSEDIRSEYRKNFHIPESCTVIGYAAGFNAVKNHKFLIDVFKKYLAMQDDAMLWLAGNGQELESVKEYAAELHVQNKVLFLGERSDVPKLLNAFDYVVFPSLSEGLGISILEAEANGIPVIANKDGISGIVKVNDNFEFLPMGDSDLWANTLSAMPRERELEGDKHVSAAGFDINLQAQKLMEIYQDSFGREGKKAPS